MKRQRSWSPSPLSLQLHATLSVYGSAVSASPGNKLQGETEPLKNDRTTYINRSTSHKGSTRAATLLVGAAGEPAVGEPTAARRAV